MRQSIVPVLIALGLAAEPACGQLKLSEKTTVQFATLEEGRAILTSRDDFVQRMSPFDRAARLKTDREVSERDYLDFVGENVLAWNDAEKERVHSALRAIQPEFEALSLPLPQQVMLIKTTGNEEGGAAYTRANAIILPEAEVKRPVSRIRKTVSHELFHVLSRANPELRERLYEAIGFVKCEEVAFPPELKARKITNPDAPRNDHCIRLDVDGTEHWAVPILFSSVEKYDVARGGKFFKYLQFQFLLVERPEGSATVTSLDDGGGAKLVSPQEVRGFFEQVGRNTRYIIHPEEILADNFALLVLGARDVPSPEIVKRLEKVLSSSKNESGNR